MTEQEKIEQFENKCMDLIEKIVRISPKQDRKGAILVAQKMYEDATAKGSPKAVLDIFKRVVHEFEIATDSEYEMLRKQIFE